MKTRLMHRVFASVAGSLLVFGAMTVSVSAGKVPTAPGQNKLLCFDGTTDTGFGGTCTLTSNGAKGPAILDLTSPNPNGDYAGVYVLESTVYGQLLSKITQLSYSYTGTIAPLPGNLSLNVPIDADGSGTTDFYLFVDAYYCPGVAGYVDIILDPTCGMWAEGVGYSNWASFVAAYPDAKVAMDAYTFLIAERTPAEPAAVWTVSNVKFGKAGK